MDRYPSAKPNAARLYLSELPRAASVALNRGGRLRNLTLGRVTKRASLPRVLAGLRFGTCHVVAQLDGSGRSLLVGAFGGNECNWYVEVPELALPLDGQVIRAPWHGRLTATAIGRPIVIVGASAAGSPLSQGRFRSTPSRSTGTGSRPVEPATGRRPRSTRTRRLRSMTRRRSSPTPRGCSV